MRVKARRMYPGDTMHGRFVALAVQEVHVACRVRWVSVLDAVLC